MTKVPCSVSTSSGSSLIEQAYNAFIEISVSPKGHCALIPEKYLPATFPTSLPPNGYLGFCHGLWDSLSFQLSAHWEVWLMFWAVRRWGLWLQRVQIQSRRDVAHWKPYSKIKKEIKGKQRTEARRKVKKSNWYTSIIKCHTFRGRIVEMPWRPFTRGKGSKAK